MSKFYYQNKEGDIVVSKTGIPSKDDKALTETIIAEAKEKELIPSDGGSAIPGPQGPKGDKGDKGDTGPQGPAGKDGKDGVDGQDGADAVLPSFKTINGEEITGEGDISISGDSSNGPIDITLSDLHLLLEELAVSDQEETPAEEPTRGGFRSADDEFATGYKYNQEYRCICKGSQFKQMWEDLDSETVMNIINYSDSDTERNDSNRNNNIVRFYTNTDQYDDNGQYFCYQTENLPFMWIDSYPLESVAPNLAVAATGMLFEHFPNAQAELPSGSVNPVYKKIIFGVVVNVDAETGNSSIETYGTNQDIAVKIIKYKVASSGGGGDDPR